MFKSLAMFAAIAVTSLSASQSHHLCEGFLPENEMNIPVGTTTMSGMRLQGISEADFNAVIDKAYALYKDEVKAKGGTLKFSRYWNNGTVNAQASQWFGTWYVDMYGGLARSRTATVEGFSLVVCHELGHHLGGAPKNWWPMSWGTNEGGSDYFSTAKCLRRLWENEDNAKAIEGQELDRFAQGSCDEQYTSVEERALCYRLALAGQSVAGIFQDSRGEEAPQFSTPDKSQVNSTENTHPATQCRLDTYFQGALCTVSHKEAVSDRDYRVGTCTSRTHQVGLRPRCWFKPDSAE